MTPLQIQMMLHYYAIPTPYAEHNPRHANSEAVEDQRIDLIWHELLMSDPNSPAKYSVTERGRVYVDGLCAMPLPMKKWVMPNAA